MITFSDIREEHAHLVPGPDQRLVPIAVRYIHIIMLYLYLSDTTIFVA